MQTQQIEEKLKAAINGGEAETGLFQFGDQYVVVDIVGTALGDQMTFTWFDRIQTIPGL